MTTPSASWAMGATLTGLPPPAPAPPAGASGPCASSTRRTLHTTGTPRPGRRSPVPSGGGRLGRPSRCPTTDGASQPSTGPRCSLGASTRTAPCAGAGGGAGRATCAATSSRGRCATIGTPCARDGPRACRRGGGKAPGARRGCRSASGRAR